MPYLIPLLIAAISLALYDTELLQRGRRIVFWCLFVYTSLLFGLRDMIGYDTIHLYTNAYAVYPDWEMMMADRGTVNPSFAPAFHWLIILFKTIGAPYWLFQLTVSTFMNFAVCLFIERKLKSPFTAMLLYLGCMALTINIEILRQGMAIGVFLLSYGLLERRRWVSYYLCVLLACMFHMSAVLLLFLPLATLARLQFNRRFFYYLLISCAITALMYVSIEPIARLFGETYGHKILWYTFSHNENTGLNYKYYIYHISLISVLPALVMAYYKLMLKREFRFEAVTCAMILLAPGAIPFGVAFLRLSWFLLPFFLFGTSECMGVDWRSRNLRHILISAMLALFIIFCNSYETLKTFVANDDYYPYRSVVWPSEAEADVHTTP